MPMTAWEDVAGHRCEVEGCDNPATHIYGTQYICCQCHGGDAILPEEAQEEHDKVLEARRKGNADGDA